MCINYHAHQASQFRILFDRQIEKVYRATLECLNRFGVNVLNAEARDLLARAGVLEIAHQNSVAPNDISRIRVRTFAAAVKLSRTHPQNTEQAQSHLAYPVAAALIDGELAPRQVLPPRIHDGAVLALADRVEAEAVPEYEQAFPEKAYADVEVVTRDGRIFTALRKQTPWEPASTLPTDDELSEKCQWLACPVLGKDRAKGISKMIWAFEGTGDVTQLIERCVVRQP